MKLRLILLVLSLLAILSTSTGGLLYYQALKESAFKDAERQTVSRLAMIQRNLEAYLSENHKPVRTLAGMQQLRDYLTRSGDSRAQREANAVLDLFQSSLKAEVCYLMDQNGITLASSNRHARDSFVGKNFSFRPYFQEANLEAPSTYLALGTTSGKRGIYYSYPIFETGGEEPFGLAVIKSSVELVEKNLDLFDDEIILMVDPMGIIFVSNHRDLLFKSIHELSPQEELSVRNSRQFGQGPWPSASFEFVDAHHVRDARGTDYLLNRMSLEKHTGWDVLYLKKRQTIANNVSEPLIRSTGPIILSLCILIGISVFFLYREASAEIRRRRTAEAALRQSEERYRYLYHHTPAMLHSIDAQERLVSVSDHWSEVMGYSREEAIGRPLTQFLTPESRRRAETEVFPRFFRSGFCKDVAYQFVKKDGGIIDILLSAIADRDLADNSVRSLAVSIDVTERNRAVADLERAKEELARYSKELEGQVRKRTREISSILKYTPDMVYFKDTRGCYRLVNTRFEDIFGVSNAEIRGCRDQDVLPPEVVDQFCRNDKRVLDQGRSAMVEEAIPQADGMHTYLAVRFPVYNTRGIVDGVGAISTDITALKKAQNQLRRLSGAIMEGQEKERAAIARELHDELGQVLTALRMEAVWLRDHLGERDPQAAERALTMCRLIDKNIQDVRGLAKRLRPVVLDDLGLVDALENLTADFESRTGISCILEHTPVPAMHDTIATAAYRIVQEALTNVARHASAAHVTVHLRHSGDRLELSVADDGRGFDLGSLGEAEGLGVAGMRERAGLAGGVLIMESHLGEGTRASFQARLTSGATSIHNTGTES